MRRAVRIGLALLFVAVGVTATPTVGLAAPAAPSRPTFVCAPGESPLVCVAATSVWLALDAAGLAATDSVVAGMLAAMADRMASPPHLGECTTAEPNADPCLVTDQQLQSLYAQLVYASAQALAQSDQGIAQDVIDAACLLYPAWSVCPPDAAPTAEAWATSAGAPAYRGTLQAWYGQSAGQQTMVFVVPAVSAFAGTAWQVLGRTSNPSYPQYWTELQVRFLAVGTAEAPMREAQARWCTEAGGSCGPHIEASYGPSMDGGGWAVGFTRRTGSWCTGTQTWAQSAYRGTTPGNAVSTEDIYGAVCAWDGLGNGQTTFASRGALADQVYLQTYTGAKTFDELRTLINGYSSQYHADMLGTVWVNPSPWVDPESDTDTHRAAPVAVPSQDPAVPPAAPSIGTQPSTSPNTTVPSPANDTETQTNAIAGFFDNLASRIGSSFGWLGGLIGSWITWLLQELAKWFKWLGDGIMDLLRWLGQLLLIAIDWLKLIRDGLVLMTGSIVQMLGSVLSGIVQALGNLGTLVASWLATVVQAIVNLPVTLLNGLQGLLGTLFVPQSLTALDLRDCEAGFPCGWVQELADTIGGLGAGIGDAAAGACTPPSIGWTEFRVSLPPPSGCSAAAGSLPAVGAESAGDLFGYRVALRAAALLAFSWFFVMRVLAMTPWAEREYYRANPTQQTLFD